jgi:hypothetical protein
MAEQGTLNILLLTLLNVSVLWTFIQGDQRESNGLKKYSVAFQLEMDLLLQN